MNNTLTKDEELAILTALSKRINERLKDLKSDTKRELMELSEVYGTDRRKIKIGNEPVGNVSIVYTSPGAAINPSKTAEALEYLSSLGLTKQVPINGWQGRFAHAGEDVIDTETGELCPFLTWEPSRPKTAMISGCKPDDILKAMSTRIESVNIIGLLEGE